MKTFELKKLSQALAGLAFVAFGNSAMAGWDLNTTCAPEGGLVANVLHNCGPNITVSGFSTSGTSGAVFAAASIYNWTEGLGVVASNESSSAGGPHATDNIGGTDAVLIKFDVATSLTSAVIGWNGTDNPTTISSGAGAGSYTDSDLSVLAWVGPGIPEGVVAGLTVGGATGLVNAGWQWIGNYADVGSAANGNTAAISTTVNSSYWLVTAYDTAFGTTRSNGSGTLGGSNDAFKLATLTGTTTYKTPEPGSLVLLGAGLLGIAAIRRLKQLPV